MGASRSGSSPGNFNDAGELEVYDKESVGTYAHDHVGVEAGASIISPPLGKKIEITGCYVSTDDKLTDIELTGSDGTEVFKLYTTNQQTGTAVNVHIDLNIDETLNLTCGAGTFVAVTYYEK